MLYVKCINNQVYLHCTPLIQTSVTKTKQSDAPSNAVIVSFAFKHSV